MTLPPCTRMKSDCALVTLETSEIRGVVALATRFAPRGADDDAAAAFAWLRAGTRVVAPPLAPATSPAVRVPPLPPAGARAVSSGAAVAVGSLLAAARAAAVVDAVFTDAWPAHLPTLPARPPEKAVVVDDESPDKEVAAAPVRAAKRAAAVVSPVTAPARPRKKARRAARRDPAPAGAVACDRGPGRSDPADETFRATLYTPADEAKLNPGHVLLRRKLLEVGRTKAGRVFFQCIGCRHLPREDRVDHSVISPRSLKTLYNRAGSFVTDHVRRCPFVPREDKEICAIATKNKFKDGTKAHWKKSAKAIGLRDRADGKHIIYCKPL